MKSSIFRGLVCASILVFAIGCGKDNKSGGGVSGVNLYHQNLDTSSQTAIQQLSTWYNGATEGTAQSQGYYGGQAPSIFNIKKYKFTSSSSNSNCNTNQVSGGWLGNILGAIGMNQYTICSGSNVSGQQGTLVSTQQNVNLNHLMGSAISAKGNAELAAVVSGAKGQLINATGGYGSVIRLVFLNGNTISTYTIDKNYHSAFNPVIVVETVNGVVTETRTYGDVVY
jgi:uncharacterized membrane protein